jgi:hypothetical protein
MTSQRDPNIQAAIIELAEASLEAPEFGSIAAAADRYVLVDPEPRTSTGWLAFAGSAAAVVLLLGGLAWLLNRPAEEVVEEPPATTTTMQVPTSTTQPPPSTATTIPPTQALPGSATVFGVEHGLPWERSANVAVTGDGVVWADIIGPGTEDCPWAMARFDGTAWSILETADDGSSPPPTLSSCWSSPFVGASDDGTLWFLGESVEPLSDDEPPVFRSGFWSWKDGVWFDHGVVSAHPDAREMGVNLASHPSYVPTEAIWFGTGDTVWLALEEPGRSHSPSFLGPNTVSALGRYSSGQWEVFDLSETNLVSVLGGEEASWNFDPRCLSGTVDDQGVLWLTGDAAARVGFDGLAWTMEGDRAAEHWGGFCLPSVGQSARGPDGSAWYAAEGRRGAGEGLVRWHDGERTAWDVADTWSSEHALPSLGYGQNLAVGPDGTVWIPAYGSQWIPATGELVAFDPGREQWGVVPADAGLPATGWNKVAVDADGAVWLAGLSGVARYVPGELIDTSATGTVLPDLASLEWRATPLPVGELPDDFTATLEHVGAAWIYAASDGALLVVGNAGADPGTYMGITWIALDGERWQRVTIVPGVTDFLIEGFSTTDDGYLVKASAQDGGGSTATSRYEYWASENGIDWSLAETAPIGEEASLAVDDLFTDEDKGWGYASFDDEATASTFGADATPQGVLVLDDRIVVVGTLHRWTDPIVWVADRP